MEVAIVSGPRRPRKWRVDWDQVTASDKWRDECYTPTRNEQDKVQVIQQERFGTSGIELYAVATKTAIPDEMPISGKYSGEWITAVLLSGCAGYAQRPNAKDVLNAIKSQEPNEVERHALSAYLKEATEDNVRQAWLAGEFSMHDMMRAVERTTPKDDMVVVRTLRKWLISE